MNKNVNKTNNIIILVTVLGMVFVLSLFLFVNIENNRVIKMIQINAKIPHIDIFITFIYIFLSIILNQKDFFILLSINS